MVVTSKHTQVIYSYYFFPIKFYSLIVTIIYSSIYFSVPITCIGTN